MYVYAHLCWIDYAILCNILHNYARNIYAELCQIMHVYVDLCEIMHDYAIQFMQYYAILCIIMQGKFMQNYAKLCMFM